MEVTDRDKGPMPPPQYGMQQLGPARIRVLSSAGGGWGDPLTRDPQAVLDDVRDEIVSEQAAREVYGVALSADGRSVDAAVTARLRAGAGAG